MRADQCRFCSSRRCYNRLVSIDRRHPWDELACRNHVRDLELLADKENPKAVRIATQSTGRLSRGVVTVDWYSLSIWVDAARKGKFPLRDLVLMRGDSAIPDYARAGILGEVPSER